MHINFFPVFALIWSLVFAFPFVGNAAPQILGLVATATPLPLSCIEGVCSVEVSGVCLQEHRQAPAAGTAYRVAKGSKLTLIVQSRDGITQTMAVGELVDVRSLRVFSSLLVSLPERLVHDLGKDVVLASLSVSPLTSLLPVPEVGDANPLSDNEIREYTGPLRAVAESALGHDKTNLNATRILNQMVNRLPVNKSVGAEGIEKALGQMMDEETAAQMPSVARLVNGALDTCREKLRVERTPHLRACISNQHDILNSNTTLNVWRSLRPGS